MKITHLTFISIVLLGLTACNNANTTPPANGERPTQQSNSSPVANPNPANESTTLVSFYVEDGVAIKGTDPVAYFTEGQPLPGSAEFEYEWKGATWQFAWYFLRAIVFFFFTPAVSSTPKILKFALGEGGDKLSNQL